jgi:hypothetical protein
VKRLCGVRPAIPEPLDAELVHRARAEAWVYLDGLDEPDVDAPGVELETEVEVDDPFDMFTDACRRADEPRRRAPISETIARARRLLDDGVTLERAWNELNTITGRAASSTVAALGYSLRERGTRALDEPDTRRRLGELNDEQLIAVGAQLRGLKSRAWSADEVSILLETRECRT